MSSQPKITSFFTKSVDNTRQVATEARASADRKTESTKQPNERAKKRAESASDDDEAMPTKVIKLDATETRTDDVPAKVVSILPPAISLNENAVPVSTANLHPMVKLIPATWKPGLLPWIAKSEAFQKLLKFLDSEKASKKAIYPPEKMIFSALAATPLDKVRVVIIGQDPYHQPRQAHGLCFSVPPGVPSPPSLINIMQEIKSDLDIQDMNVKNGTLFKWAQQGVLLLNAVLSVEANKAASHSGKGWEEFTDKVIDLVCESNEKVVFLLWGNYAKKKGSRIDRTKHVVLEANHPSPLSANRGGWFGCRHFSKTNEALQKFGYAPIDWKLE